MSEDKKTIVKMAHIYSQEGRWDKAIAEYKKLIKIEPEDFNSYSMLGDVYVKKGELQPAFDAYLVCSDAYIRLGQLEKAALVQSKIARLSPDTLNPESQKKQQIFQKQVEGDKALDAGEFDAAVQAYQAVLAMDPDRFDLYQKLGDLYLRKGEISAACSKYMEIGDIYLKNRLIKKAAPIYLKIVELDPENVEAHAALADIQAKSGNESEAKKELLLLAEFLFQRGDLDRAFQFAQKAEQLKAIESYNYLGHVELRRGKRAEARAWFEKLLKFKLSHGGALWGLGLVQFQEGKYDEALKSLAKVPKTDRFYGEALECIAQIELAQGQKEEAHQHFRDAAALLKAKGAVEQAKAASESGAQLADELGFSSAPPPSPEPEPMPPPPAEVAPAPAPMPVAPAPAPVAATPQPFAAPVAPPMEDSFADGGLDGDDAETLMALADNFEAEGSLDEALGLYQRVLAVDPANAAAREGMSRAYRQLAGGNAAAVPAPTVAAAPLPPLPPLPPAPSAQEEFAKLAALKAKAEADQARAQEEAKRQEDERLRAEAEAQRVRAERERAEEQARVAQLEREKAEAEAQRLRAQAEEERARAESAARKAKVESEAEKARLEAEAMAERLRAEAQLKREREERERAEAEAQERIENEVRLRAETESKLNAEIAALRKAEAEAKRLSEEAAEQALAMKIRMEAEIRAKLEEEMRKSVEEDMRRKAEEEVARKVQEARRQAEEEARRHAEAEIRRQFDEERKKLEHEKAEVKREREEDLKRQITAKVQLQQEQETERKVEAVRVHEEEGARRRQAEVLARIQAQQKEKQAPMQRTIEEMRRKFEEQAAAHAAAAAAEAGTAGPAAPPAPPHEPVVAAPLPGQRVEDDLDEMDDFMTAAVADIYVKQGLKLEAQKIYERILKREPRNADVRAKLDDLLGIKTTPPADSPKADGPSAVPKKSKVSYL